MPIDAPDQLACRRKFTIMSPGGHSVASIREGKTNHMILAYLDPGSGSLILQAVLGGVAGLGVAAKAMRNRWRSRSADEHTSNEDADEEAVPADQEG